MARMIEHLQEAIKPEFIPADQRYMRESIIVGTTPKEMHCEVLHNNKQEYLLCQFDRQGFNNLNFPYFDSSVDGLVSMCDYLLFVEEADRLLVLLVELKHRGSPKSQLDINLSFGRFICERLKLVFPDFDKPYTLLRICVKEKYNPLHGTQDYVFEFHEGFAMLPNPSSMKLDMISKKVPEL